MGNVPGAMVLTRTPVCAKVVASMRLRCAVAAPVRVAPEVSSVENVAQRPRDTPQQEEEDQETEPAKKKGRAEKGPVKTYRP